MELIQVADAVAREKGIDQEIVLTAMEEAIQKAGCSKYGHDRDIRAFIDRKTGEIKIFRYQEVVAVKGVVKIEEFEEPQESNENEENDKSEESSETVATVETSESKDVEIEKKVEIEEDFENEHKQILLADAQEINKDIQIGEFIIDPLPPVDFGRIAAQTAKQVILQKVREAERGRQFGEYKDRVGEIINGVVKRVEYGNVTIDLGRAEGYMRRDEALPREHFKNGERVRAYVYDVREEQRGPQIFLSRTRPEFMAGLFKQEVPEIYDGIIEIRSVARDPGSRAKIAVISSDFSIDPVGACVGMRGSRVQTIVNELQGEKIDIIPWTEDTAKFIVNALAPAEVSKVVLDNDKRRIDVVVPDEQLSLAIGRRGQNVRLASTLSGWNIDIMTEEDESTRRKEETEKRTGLFLDALDVDDVIAHLLVVEGFASILDVAETPIEEIAKIEGFDEDIAIELQNRAANFLNEKQTKCENRLTELKVQSDLIEKSGLPDDMLVKLAESEIKTLDDLGDLAADELREIVGEKNITEKEANSTIMAIRETWFAENEDENTKKEDIA